MWIHPDFCPNPELRNGDEYTVNGSSITVKMLVVGNNQDQLRVITACSRPSCTDSRRTN